DSPLFSYVSNLSPILPGKDTPVAHGFSGFSSSALVFTSPHINSHKSLQKRWQRSYASVLGSQENDKCLKNVSFADDSGEMDPQSSTILISGDQKGCDAKDSGRVKLCSPSSCINECLSELADGKQANSGRREQYSDVPRSSKDGFVEKEDSEEDRDMNLGASATLSQQPEFFEGGPVIDVKLLENEPWILSSTKCSEIQFVSYIGHVSEQQQPGDSFSEESSHVLSTTTLTDGQPIKLTSFANSLCLSSVTGNSHFAVPKPPGIGLHLNSIVTVRSISHEIENAQSPESILKGKDLVFIMKNHLANDVHASSTSSEVGKVFLSSKIEMLESKASKAGIHGKLVCQNTLKSSSIAILPQLSDNHATSYGKRKYSSELSASVEAVNQASPKRKRQALCYLMDI
ncbi:hypothetical protein Ancab_001915, partial [Ancistrocladus abbreviatus]